MIAGKYPSRKWVSTHPCFFSKEKQSGFSFVTTNRFEEFSFVDFDKCFLLEIGNDLWIGSNVLIMEGIKIGDGAIIGAGSLVTKNVEPYSINVGVPSRTIGYRFEKEEVEFLLRFKWWDKDFAFIEANSHLFIDIKVFMREFN